MIPLSFKLYDRTSGTWIKKDLWEIMEPCVEYSRMTESDKIRFAIDHKMFPTEVKLTAETYSRNAERSANYVLNKLMLVNAKAKPEFTWALLKADYAERLLKALSFHYDYEQENDQGEKEVVPEEAATIIVIYRDFIGTREIKAYLGQTIDGTLVEYDEAYKDNNQVHTKPVNYWENFRLAFPER
jgi:hypothetical protein